MLSFVVLIAVCSVILPNAALAQYASECRLPNQRNGLCMPVKSCKPTYDVFQKALAENRSITPVEAQDLQQTYCGMFSNEPHVCCPTSDVQLNPEGMEILKRQTKCGEFSTDKISNGEEAALFSYPWMALLIYNDTRDPYKCGGALISERYVITAAHCIKPDLYQIRLGEHRLSSEKDCIADGLVCAPPVANVSIELVIPHYKYSSYINDIALIRLAQSFAPQTHIRPICLPIYDELRSSKHGSYVISGWGRTENKPLSDVLMAAAIPLVERPQCETILRKYRLRRPLTEAHICAGNRDLVDSCDGDSGGPMGVKDTYNGKPRFVQFGVVAFGVNFCGEGNAPNVYTNVSHYMQWITDNMKN